MAQNDALSTRQKRAIQALISSPTITEAAAVAKVGRRTVHRWLDESEAFRQALAGAESQAITSAVRALVADMLANYATLRELRDDLEEAPSIRLRAAVALDSSLLKWREIASIEERLSALEQVLR